MQVAVAVVLMAVPLVQVVLEEAVPVQMPQEATVALENLEQAAAEVVVVPLVLEGPEAQVL